MSATQPAFRCNTCFAAFPNIDALKDHYRSPWHVFNSKRRAHNLLHVTRDTFFSLQKNVKEVAPVPPVNTAKAPVAPSSSSKALSPAKAVVPPTPPTAASETAAATEEADDEESVYEDVEEDDVGEEEEEEEVEVLAEHSLFDNKKFDNVDDCLQHMSKNYGFFIPDAEYLEDQEGLLLFLGEKVKLGHICLYCQKRFSCTTAVQRHMVDKAHCKIAYEDGVDMDDIGDFYDFTATYADRENIQVDEDGNILDEELEIAATGELVLPDGRLLGHRQFRRYYKQHYRPQPQDAVLAVQREELLRLASKFGDSISAAPSTTEIATLSDVSVMELLVRYHKQIRRSNVIEQRGAKRAENLAQRREYKSNVMKARSSQTTTEKIRDYHGILK